MLNIVIPIQEESWKLEDCIKSIEQYTTDYTLTVHKNPDLNVAEARQQAMDENKERYICFLDDDTRLTHSGWAERLIAATIDDSVGVAFAEEFWDGYEVMVPYPETQEVSVGPAACMLIDTTKIPKEVKWNKYIGLKSGWLGGDYEEVEYIGNLKNLGIKSVGVKDTRFLHVDRIPIEEYVKTDRCMTSRIMNVLIQNKLTFRLDEDYFKSLRYIKADANNDRMFASSEGLKDCFRETIINNGISHFPLWKRIGII